MYQNCPVFIDDLAERILQAKGTKGPGGSSRSTFSRMMVAGHFEASVYGDKLEVSVYPWIEDRCQYHLHTALGTLCYKRRR